MSKLSKRKTRDWEDQAVATAFDSHDWGKIITGAKNPKQARLLKQLSSHNADPIEPVHGKTYKFKGAKYVEEDESSSDEGVDTSPTPTRRSANGDSRGSKVRSNEKSNVTHDTTFSGQEDVSSSDGQSRSSTRSKPQTNKGRAKRNNIVEIDEEQKPRPEERKRTSRREAESTGAPSTKQSRMLRELLSFNKEPEPPSPG